MTIIKLYKFALVKLAAALKAASGKQAHEHQKQLTFARNAQAAAEAALTASNKLAAEARKVSALI